MNKLNAQTQYKNNNKHRTRTEAPYKNMNHHNTRTMNEHQKHETAPERFLWYDIRRHVASTTIRVSWQNADSIEIQEHRQYTVIFIVFVILVCHPDDETCFIDVRVLIYYTA